mgnify:FL=1
MNYEKLTNNIIKFVRDYYEENNIYGAVLGISGGKDSAVVAAILCKALGSERVVGLTMPCYSKEEDMRDAKKISEYYGFRLLNIDLSDIFDDFKKEINLLGNYSLEDTKNSDINIKPRMRMMSLYYMAQLLSKVEGRTYLVVGTSNKSELYVGYFTKGGDSVHDIAPIGDLMVSEVIKVGEVLGVPGEVLYKTPSDGLSGMSDEDKMGVSYDDIERYILKDDTLDKGISLKIEKMHNNSRHKFIIPMYERDEV